MGLDEQAGGMLGDGYMQEEWAHSVEGTGSKFLIIKKG